MPKNIIIVTEDDLDVNVILTDILVKELGQSFKVQSAYSGTELLNMIQYPNDQAIALILLDYELKDMTGNDVMDNIILNGLDIKVIMVTGNNRRDILAQARSKGVIDYILKPAHNDIFLEKVKNSLKKITEDVPLAELPEVDPQSDFLIVNQKSADMFNHLHDLAKSSEPVIILGESGVGKTSAAKLVHQYSNRRGAFIAVNGANLKGDPVDGELFGTEKGAFTDAVKKQGKILLAEHGTLFLDEIGDLSDEAQKALLTAVDEKWIRPLGSNDTIKTDVRYIFATNKNIEEEVKNGRFREDFYYRIVSNVITILPLRERKDEIPYLIAYYLNQHPYKPNMPPAKITQDAFDVLMEYNWPGNIRQLNNTLSRAIQSCQGEIIYPEHIFISEISKKDNFNIHTLIHDGLSMDAILQQTQIFLIQDALEHAQNNLEKAADKLKITVSKLKSLCRKFGL